MPYKDPEKRRKYQREYNRKYREENRLYQRWYQREWYKKNRDKIRLRKRKWLRTREYRYQERARRYHRFRIKALKMYGGDMPKCAICGENRYECLQIDHILGDGFKERRWNLGKRNKAAGENFYRWLIKQPFQPERYQVLCANCNTIKRLRGTISYNQGFKTIQEWKQWAKCREIQTPEEIKKLWLKKKQQRLKEGNDSF